MFMSSNSYWQQTANPVSLSTDLQPSADVVVIGGGLMGVATTYWLARAGVAVALIEREAIGWGATGRNGGFVVAGPAETYQKAIEHLGHATASALLADTLINQALLRQILQEEDINCLYREPGQLCLALTPAEEEMLRTETQAFQVDGFPAEYLEREAVQKLIQTRLAPDIRGGCLKQRQGLIHSARFVCGLIQAALRRGAHAYQASVQAIVRMGSHLSVQTSRGNIHTSTVVVAANVWTGTLLPELSDFLLVRREQAQAYAPVPSAFSMAISTSVTSGEYFQQVPNGTILIGGCKAATPGEGKGHWEMEPTFDVQSALEAILPRLFPDLPTLHIVQRWAGLIDYTSDLYPVVDCAPTSPQILFVCGLSGHGMPFGIRLGQLLSWSVTNRTTPAELKLYRLDRPTLKPWAHM